MQNYGFASRFSIISYFTAHVFLKGNTEEFATSILNNLGLVYEFEGEGNVYSQSVTAGNKVVKGTKVTITLKKEFEY